MHPNLHLTAVYEGTLVVGGTPGSPIAPAGRVGDVWLHDPGGVMLADAILEGPGSQFIGKRVRITVTVLEDLPRCVYCGQQSHKATLCPVRGDEQVIAAVEWVVAMQKLQKRVDELEEENQKLRNRDEHPNA